MADRRRRLAFLRPAGLLFALLCGALLLSGGRALAQSKPVPTSLESYEAFPASTVDTFRELLIQDGGRVKPMDTYARFTQLALFGRRSARFTTMDEEEHKIDSAEWLMNVLFRPQVARHLPSFVVDDSDAVVEFGVPAKKKRDRYSYREIAESGGDGEDEPNSRAKLAQKAQQYAQQKQKFEQAKDKQSDEAAKYELTHIQEMVLILARNVSSFEYHAGQMAFAQQGDILSAGLMPPTMMTLAQSLDAMELIEKMPAMPMDSLVQMIRSQQGGAGEDAELLSMSLQLLFFYTQSANTMAIFPPRKRSANRRSRSLRPCRRSLNRATMSRWPSRN